MTVKWRAGARLDGSPSIERNITIKANGVAALARADESELNLIDTPGVDFCASFAFNFPPAKGALLVVDATQTLSLVHRERYTTGDLREYREFFRYWK